MTGRSRAAGVLVIGLACVTAVAGEQFIYVANYGTSNISGFRIGQGGTLTSTGAPVLSGISPYALTVHPSVPARTAKELVALARQRPGQLNYGSSGNGSAQHLAGELFQMIMNVKLTHVPYKGGAQAAVATASGEVDMKCTA